MTQWPPDRGWDVALALPQSGTHHPQTEWLRGQMGVAGPSLCQHSRRYSRSVPGPARPVAEAGGLCLPRKTPREMLAAPVT